MTRVLHPHASSRPRLPRRGSTLVLVAGILVILVIVAVAYISLARVGRATAAAQQQTTIVDDRAESIGLSLASEVAEALFVRAVETPVPTIGFSGGTVSSNWRRLPILPDERPYGVDPARIDVTDPNTGEVRKFYEFPYNKAPYATIPWTNWPDALGVNATVWPVGPGAPTGLAEIAPGVPIGDGNPYGNPGFDDSRWLRSTEPQRFATTLPIAAPNQAEVFSHWLHLSNISRPDNAWRIAWDIHDIRLTPNGNNNPINVLDNLGIPVEQWLPSVVPAPINGQADFINRRDRWFGESGGFPLYGQVYLAPATTLPNFFRLKDLGPPQDEFTRGTDRWLISSTFADSDGDGFTDSFWFLAPQPIDRDTRQVVAMSIVDNSGLLNVNVASLFDPRSTAGANPGDLALLGFSSPPVGFLENPANAAPATIYNYTSSEPANKKLTGFTGFDLNRYGAGANPDKSMYLQARGLQDAAGNPNPLITDYNQSPDLQGTLLSPLERLKAFNGGFLGRGPEALGLTPFGSAEELELRANHGQNHPNITTRLERAFDDGGLDFAFLRATPLRPEVNEYLDQLNNPQLVHDNRRKITAFSGARNDLSPPWLWSSPRFETDIDYNRDGFDFATDGGATANAALLLAQDRATWESQRRKLDLRQPMDEPILAADGSVTPLSPAEIATNRRLWRQEMRRLLRQSMTSNYTFRDGATTAYQSYLGRPDDTIDEGRDAFRLTRRMLGSWTANIDQWRDGPQRREFPDGSVAYIDRPLNPRNIQEAVLYPDPSDPVEASFPDETVAFVGIEKHPVVVEVFFALVYEKTRVDPAWQAAGGPVSYGEYGCPWSPGQGENFVQFEEGNLLTPEPTVVFAVQIANPYNTPIHLADYSIRVAGKTFPLALAAQQLGLPLNYSLQPTTPERPCSLVLYSIPQAAGAYGAEFRQKWLDYLDLQATDLFDDPDNELPLDDAGTTYEPRESMVVNATSILNLPWDVFRDEDVASVEIVRNYLDDNGANGIQLVVDRFGKTDIDSDDDFSQIASKLYRDDYLPPPPKFQLEFLPPPPPGVPDPARTWYSGIRIGSDDYLVNWARASRLWLRDLDNDGFINPDERSPRFALGINTEISRVVRTNAVAVDDNGAERPNFWKGDVIEATDESPDGPDATNDAEMWLTGFTFEDQFSPPQGGVNPIRSKPVFFPMQVVIDGNFRTYEGYRYGGGGPGDVSNFNPVAGAEVRWGEKGAPKAKQYKSDRNFERFAFQFSPKDRDFEQIGEIANVPLWGPEVRYPIPGNGKAETVRTLAEILADEEDLDCETHPLERGVYRNRFRTFPGFDVGLTPDPDSLEVAVYSDPNTRAAAPVLGAAPGGLEPDQQSEWEAFHATRPRLPAGIGLFDALVCDGRGAYQRDEDGDGDIDLADLDLARLLAPANARAYTGAATPGLINLNTATPEVLRTLPHFTRMVYNDSDFGGSLAPSQVVPVPDGASPRVRVPESIIRYRDQSLTPGSARNWGEPNAFDVSADISEYRDRGLAEDQVAGYPGYFPGMRNQRGLDSVGELRLLQRVNEGQDDGTWNRRVNGSIEFAGLDPFRGPSDPLDGDFGYRGQALTFDTRLATDRNIGIASTNPNDPNAVLIPDRVPGDALERNLLFAGVSNLVGVRSDVFTVYYKVRTFRRNPITGVWDATDPEYIISDDRFVMLVDRSKVEHPDDKPEIIFLQKLGQ